MLQRNLIIKLVDQEPCVIVGHCSEYILRRRKDYFNVFIHSDIGTRAKRVIDEYHGDLKIQLKSWKNVIKRERHIIIIIQMVN